MSIATPIFFWSLFTDKQQLREFSTTIPALQQMLKDLFQTGNTEKAFSLKHKTTK